MANDKHRIASQQPVPNSVVSETVLSDVIYAAWNFLGAGAAWPGSDKLAKAMMHYLPATLQQSGQTEAELLRACRRFVDDPMVVNPHPHRVALLERIDAHLNATQGEGA